MRPECNFLRKRIHNSVTPFILFIIIPIFVFPCVSGYGNYTSNPSTCTLLTILSENTDQMYPAIYGDCILWVDSPANGTLHLYDPSSGNETVLISNHITAEGMFPDIFENYLSFTTMRNSEYQVILHDLQTGEELLVAGGNGTTAWNPHLGNNILVWEDNRYGSFDIFSLNLTTGDEQDLTPDMHDSDQTNPVVSENWVAWQSFNADTYMNDIYVHSLVSGNTTLITTESEYLDEKNPAIDVDYLVYQGMNPDTFLGEIYLYTLSSGTTILLTPGTENANKEYPAIHNGTVVWIGQDPEGGTYHLFIYETASGITHILERPENEIYPSFPAMYGNRIVWQQQDPETGYSDIFMATLGIEDPPLVADFSADTHVGGPPLAVNFTDLSSGDPSGWLWDFGDGNYSVESDPTHVYDSQGTFDVSLILHTPTQRSGKRNTGYIFAGSPPTPSFSLDRFEGLHPLTVRFGDHSTGFPDSYMWDFGDGTSSQEMNPVHVYTSPGSYDVSLTTGNEYGNSTTSIEECIMVMEGTRNEMLFDIPGITYEELASYSQLTLNASLVSLNVVDNATIEVFPDPGYGIACINITSAYGFTWNTPSLVSGIPMELLIDSPEIHYSGDKYGGTVRSQIAMNEYPALGHIQSSIWENATQNDYALFNHVAIFGNTSSPDNSLYSGVKGVAFTAQFECKNITGSPPAELIFGLDSDWIQEYGWRRRVIAESDQEDTKIYLDGDFLGFAPVELPLNLSAGDHRITGTKAGFPDNVSVVSIGDKKESIRVIRLIGGGSGEILTTEFMYHDPANNLDYFRAESPHGFSTFGVVSVSDAGNPIQIIFLALQELLPKLLAGGGGGGGPSSPPPAGKDAPSPTTISNPNGVPGTIPTITNIVTSTSTPTPGVTEVATPKLGETRDKPIIQTNPGEVVPPIPFTLIQTIAILFGAIFVITVLILRMQKGGGGS